MTLELGADDRRFVYAIGKRLVREPDAADEVAQEAMLAALRRRDSFRGASHPRTWLYRIATNTAFDYLRRQRRRANLEAAAIEHERVTHVSAPRPDDLLAAAETTRELDAEIDRIDEKYAAVLRLRAADLGDPEIAERLGVSLGVVKVRAHRARGFLREALAKVA